MLVSDSVQMHGAGVGRPVVLDILAAILISLVGLAILETSSKSFIFQFILNVNYRLPVSLVVYLGSLFFGAALFLLNKAHGFCYWFRPIRGDIARPILGSYGWIVTVSCLALVALLIWHSFGVPIDRKLKDPFHEGEILAGFTIMQQAADVPILIHGPGRNLLPGVLAAHFAEPVRKIAFMRFVTGIGAMMTLFMVSAATYVFSFTLLDSLSPTSERCAISAFASMLATLIAFIEAYISNRHVLFLLALALAAAVIHASDQRKRWAFKLAAGLGVVCALAPIYVYATGLETLAVALIVAAILLFRLGRYAWRVLATGIAGFVTCIILIFLFGGGELYFNAIRDITWWVLEAGGVWSRPLLGVTAIKHTALLIGTIALTGILATHFACSKDPCERRSAALLSLLAFAIAIAARDMVNRSDAAHTGMSMLTVAIGIGTLSGLLLLRLGLLVRKLGAYSLVILTSLGVVVVLSISEPRQVYMKIISALGDGVPELRLLETPDSDILPDEIVAFAEWYKSDFQNEDCLLVLTNEGVLNYVANLAPCGDFLYPIYASVPSGDHRLADWLLANPQNIAVVETHFWSDNIDGKPMRNRLPRVWAIVEETMLARKKIEGRVFAVSQ